MKKIMLMFFSFFLFYNCTLTDTPPRSMAKVPIPVNEESTGQVLYYSQFGARGDGTVCDFDAIRRTHDAANISGARVIADPGAIYYIGPTTKYVSIQTDTDWGDARFIMDDQTIEKRGTAWAHNWIFIVESAKKSFPVYSISGLKKGQTHVPVNLGQRVMIEVIDNTSRNYIRQGENENAGEFLRDLFIVEKDGSVDPNTPIIWDFQSISSAVAYPIDDNQLTIRGGRFTTIAKRGNNTDPYV